jgi:hypothetical protein
MIVLDTKAGTAGGATGSLSGRMVLVTGTGAENCIWLAICPPIHAPRTSATASPNPANPRRPARAASAINPERGTLSKDIAGFPKPAS